MSIFPVFDTASSALRTNRVWMDAISDNLANLNTIRPYDQPAFQARFVQAQELPSNPGDPMANAQGIVRSPNIDVSQNMTDLILAQRAYQLNLAVVDRASQSYQQAIQINGK